MKKNHAKTKIALFILTFSLGINLALAATTVPEEITDLTTTPGNAEVTLNWTEPYNGGSAITGYTVQYKTVASGAFEAGTACTGPDCQTCIDATCTDTTAGATVPSLTNWTDYKFRVFAENAEGFNTTSNIVNTIPSPCIGLKFNDDSSGTSTISDSCAGLTIETGGISIVNVPDSFSFPQKYSSTSSQHNFSNDDPGTAEIDITTAPNDILTITDLRDSGGFDVTITSTNFQSGANTIALENLYIATSYPDADDLDQNLSGTEIDGVEVADGSSSTSNIVSPVHSDNVRGTVESQGDLTNLITAYTTDGANFDSNQDLTPDIITLIDSNEARIAGISQAVNFYVNIPADQISGKYSILLTIDLIPN